jgi:hypothetical protein
MTLKRIAGEYIVENKTMGWVWYFATIAEALGWVSYLNA